jgi:hypothetical protein
MTSKPDTGIKTSFYLLMLCAALFGALSSLLAVGFITLYNQGVNFFEQVNLVVLNINVWPLVLLTGAGLVIKFFGQNGDYLVVSYKGFCNCVYRGNRDISYKYKFTEIYRSRHNCVNVTQLIKQIFIA